MGGRVSPRLGGGAGGGVDRGSRQRGIDDVWVVGIEEGDAVDVGEGRVPAFEVFWGRGRVVLGLGDCGFCCGGGAGGDEVEYCEWSQSREVKL